MKNFKFFSTLAVFALLLAQPLFASPPPGDPPFGNAPGYEASAQTTLEFFDSPDGCVSLTYASADADCAVFPATLSVYETTCTTPQVSDVIASRSLGVTALYHRDTHRLIVVIDEASGLISLIGNDDDDYRQRCGRWVSRE